MKKALLIIIPIFCSCINKKVEKVQEDTAAYKKYSLVPNDSGGKKTEIADTITSDKSKSFAIDTVGYHLSPVKVIKTWLIGRTYSTYKDIGLSYKNVSEKKVKAIRFRWYGETAFGDPADMGSYSYEGYGGGFDDTPLSPGRTSSGEWSILSRNANKVLLAWVTEVAFADGTKWEIGR